jgi:hypothetical protein
MASSGLGQSLQQAARSSEVSLAELRDEAKSDWRKPLLAELVQSQTIMRLDWIRQTLNMGDRSSCCRLIRQTRQALPERREWSRIRKQIVEMSKKHD